jgi:hypothetical protein
LVLLFRDASVVAAKTLTPDSLVPWPLFAR